MTAAEIESADQHIEEAIKVGNLEDYLTELTKKVQLGSRYVRKRESRLHSEEKQNLFMIGTVESKSEASPMEKIVDVCF